MSSDPKALWQHFVNEQEWEENNWEKKKSLSEVLRSVGVYCDR